MKYSPVLVFILSLLGAVYIQAEEVLPPQFNFDRYSKMVEHSPFAVATAVAPPAATPDFTKDLYIATAARSPEGDLVTLASTSDHNFKKYLTTSEPADGYSIDNIEWSDKVGATKVTLSKDGNFATLTFNQALLSNSGPGAGAASRVFTPAMPAAPVPNPASIPQQLSPKLPPELPPEMQQLIPSREATRPHARGLIQRNPRGSQKTSSQAPAGQYALTGSSYACAL